MEMEKLSFKERDIKQFMERDFYFDGVQGIKKQEPIQHIYNDKQKLQQLVKLLHAYPKDTDRKPSDFKELRALCECFYWMKHNIFGFEFGSSEVNELIKHVKVKFYKANQVVY